MYFLRKMRGEVLEKISNAVGYANFFRRSHDAVIRIYDEARNVIILGRKTAFTQAYQRTTNYGKLYICQTCPSFVVGKLGVRQHGRGEHPYS
jgi:hypothetical protein